MSRSNPSENGTPNPATRWFEWNGELGVVRYYDKETKKNIDVGSDFTFILLDQLGTVKGWHDASDSGIYSNEVKDTRQEVMLVKSFKGGTLAEGIYASIKDRIKAEGGQFVANCYIAFKNGNGGLKLGSLRFKGAALGAWMEFCKSNRADLYTKAIHIGGFTSGKKGRIEFRMPVLSTLAISADTDKAAVELDKVLQEFLRSYLKRTKRDQVEDVRKAAAPEDVPDAEPYDDNDGLGDTEGLDSAGPALTDDDIPF
jgi:hypothetical protein